jgi:uncharacterized NAD(P)/FAD-binding protein YdhS
LARSISGNPTVVVAGGGASGALFAAELVRECSNASVVIVEPRERLGIGVAYATECPWHVLNVPAANMSARADDPDDFLRWLRERCERFDGASFVPRATYGDYLTSIAARAAKASGSRWRHARAAVCDAAIEDDRVAVTLSSGERLQADALVLALGNGEPRRWSRVEDRCRDSSAFFDSAWRPGALAACDPLAEILLIGSGLTAIDAALGLRHAGHRGTVHMVSRRGLIPRVHRAPSVRARASTRPTALHESIRATRADARESASVCGDWRPAVDGMRGSTNALWQALTTAEQRRFLAHVLPFWNAHRHRMAPEVGEQISAWIAAGDVRPLAGRIEAITPVGDRLSVSVRPRGGGPVRALRVARAIDCRGSEYDVNRSSSPIVRRLMERGLMQPSRAGIGPCIASDGSLMGSRGASQEIFTLGPVRFGTLVETTAIPEIREQVRDLAHLLASRFECV